MPTRIERGLYEALITEAMQSSLATMDDRQIQQREPLRAAEAADRIAWHIGQIVSRAVEHIGEKDRSKLGIALAKRLIGEIHAAISGADVLPDSPVDSGEVLHAILGRRPDGEPAEITKPLIPLLDTALLTNAPGEPRVGSALHAEIASADQIDMIMAFVRYSGLRPFLEVLQRHCASGRVLRVLTTIYTESTEPRALDALRDLGCDVRVSYDTTTTRLHAKAWLFHRHSGFSTAYIGSSNLTHSAQRDGLEWNLRLSGARNKSVVEKMLAVFESYWSSQDFDIYDRAEYISRLSAARQSSTESALSPIELRLEPFQERLLEQIDVSRQLGHHRNLLVSATGTGKTVMAAVDYARLAERLTRSRLLFVAHREEILEKSRDTFRHCLRDTAFGELWVGGKRPARFEHVFASVQSLAATGLADLASDHFDVVVVDEFHHAAAKSYIALLEHLAPQELLGLTATPDRSDGLPLLQWFGGRIAAELRLWDAIEQQRLCPFSYFGIHDGMDLRDVPWRRGRGYDLEGLTNVLTASDAWAKRVIAQLEKHVSNVQEIRALGFCVSITHAQFMARVFNEAGLPSVAISADTPREERSTALHRLARKELKVVFSVDLFNEGIDVPSLDTLLMLRPTESPTLFLQQLGRGLRRSHAKAGCTVLDFVGHHRHEFRFDRRLRALLGGTRADVMRQIEDGFPYLPAGCHMELDAVASEIVLSSIRRAIPSNWSAKLEELRSLAQSAPDATLSAFLMHSGLEIEDVYANNKSWSDLRTAAGMSTFPAGPHEAVLRRACGRLLHVDDLSRIDSYRNLLSATDVPSVDALDDHDRRLLRMLTATMASTALSKEDLLSAAAQLVWQHPQVRAELLEILDVLRARIDHIHTPASEPNVPLQVHARYTRAEILAGFGVGTAAKPPTWQTGVWWAPEAKTDLLAFTLDKTSGGFSPTTRYRDYAISRELIHWESQSVTRADSKTGQRYQQHKALGTNVVLFARLRNDDRAFWCLGPAEYVRHESQMPMGITWRLHHPLSGDLYAQFAAAVA